MVIEASLPSLLVSLIQKIHDHTLGLMIQLFPKVWNISGVMNCVAFSFCRGVCNAVVFHGINTPNAAVCFTLTAHLDTTSMIAWAIGSKVIMTGIGLSPSYLTPTKIPLINNWHPSFMKWYLEHYDPFPHATDIPAGCSFNNHDIISSDCVCFREVN